MNKAPYWPRISIITSSYNQGEFLEKTILSVLGQHYPDLEYIIIDGGSKDESVEIIKKYEKYLAYWKSEPDKGFSDALNKGFFRASGEVLFYLNSDDILLPGVLHKISNIFRKNKTIDMVYGNKLIINAKDQVVSERRVTRWVPLVSKIGFLLNAGFGIYLDCAFFRKEVFERVGQFNLAYRNAMDTDFVLRLIKLNPRLHFLREPIIGFRIHDKSLTYNNGQNSGIIETKKIFLEGNPFKAKYCLVFRPFLKTLWYLMFILQLDFVFIIRRYFLEKRSNYAEILK